MRVRRNGWECGGAGRQRGGDVRLLLAQGRAAERLWRPLRAHGADTGCDGWPHHQPPRRAPWGRLRAAPGCAGRLPSERRGVRGRAGAGAVVAAKGKGSRDEGSREQGAKRGTERVGGVRVCSGAEGDVEDGGAAVAAVAAFPLIPRPLVPRSLDLSPAQLNRIESRTSRWAAARTRTNWAVCIRPSMGLSRSIMPRNSPP